MPSLAFDNRFVAELPGDPDTAIRPRQVVGAAWSPVLPTPVAAPRLLAWSPECAALLGLSAADLEAPGMVAVLAGNATLEGMRPVATNYGGHQFGTWAGQLGDGRAISLGEALAPDGSRWELQLKGAGPTPYSRRADGRAVLRSSLREFLCSEAMHFLGVPTTRALSLVTTGEPVVRDMLYDGHPRDEPGAIVCRVAPSFIRFGHFELPAARGDHALLERFVDFTIARDFPHLEGDVATRRTAWFREVCERTAVLVAHWMRVGFVHGVMNTDNMSILGLTIDYGPYGWIDDFDPTWTPNTTDAVGRRYRYGQQPAVAQWNLVQLAEALVPCFASPEPLEAGLARFLEVANAELETMHGAKFGFRQVGERERTLVREGFALWHRLSLDMTNGFRALAELSPEAPDAARLLAHGYEPERAAAHGEALADWLGRWGAAIRAGGEPDAARIARMQAVNPRYVPRNYLAQEAIEAAEQGDAAPLLELLDVLRRPYDDQPGRARYAAPRPDWARAKPGCSMLSCSS